jgi:outer membrane receptor protein involved in Fe transport
VRFARGRPERLRNSHNRAYRSRFGVRAVRLAARTPAHPELTWEPGVDPVRSSLQPFRPNWAASPAFEGNDFSVAATLTSALSDEVASEFRAGFESSTRDYGSETVRLEDDVPGADLPSTFVVVGGSGFGSHPALPGRFERSTLRLTETLHYETGAHRLKGGVAAVLSSYDQSYTYGSRGEFFFGGVEQFARRRGSFVQTARVADAAFSVPQFAAYVQDTWNASPGFDLLLGMRLETEQRPRSEVAFNALWEERSGLRTDSTEDRRVKWSPRVGLTWDVANQHRWIIRGTAGMYHDMVDPGVLAELIGHSRGIEVRRDVGRLSSWPTVPSPPTAPNVGSRVTLLGPNFDAMPMERQTTAASLSPWSADPRGHSVFRAATPTPKRQITGCLHAEEVRTRS